MLMFDKATQRHRGKILAFTYNRSRLLLLLLLANKQYSTVQYTTNICRYDHFLYSLRPDKTKQFHI